MPILVKPRTQICNERAAADAEFYYNQFANLLIQSNNEEKDMETKQELLRLYKWIAEYKNFAYNFHMNNYIQSDDMYVKKEDAEAFGGRIKILRAPFIPVFEEIKNAND
jgi:hypothetical protein